MVPEKRQRPLSLMHVCQDCALFSVRRQQPAIGNNNEILQQTLLVAPPPFCSTTDSDLSSSPFSSPASSVDSSPETSSGVPSPKPGYIRHRSNSECNGSPVKSILKRRPMFRSLSVCEEDNYEMLKYYQNSLEDVSESTQFEDDDILGSSLNGFKKKSVSFSERVEQNFFRPNSSILGQRKKNQRKNKHRKRRESTDSLVSSENEDENHKNATTTNSNRKNDSSAHHQNTLPNVTTDEDQSVNHSIPPSPPNSDSTFLSTHSDQSSADGFVIVDHQQTKVSTKKGANKEAKNSKKKPKDKKPVIDALFTDDRYKGFVIGVQRRTSTDSALSLSTEDDEEDNTYRKGGTCESRLSLKDSGIDDEMEELCAQMTAAVVSA